MKLPRSVRSEYYRALDDEYGIGRADEFEAIESGKLPEEFRSDEWWKKRKL